MSSFAPLATASFTSLLHAIHRGLADDRAEHEIALARIAASAAQRRASRASRQTHPRPSRRTITRSVDMQIWPGVRERAEHGRIRPPLEIRIVQHDERRLAAELEQAPASGTSPRCAAMILPTRVEPVKLTRFTAGWEISASAICLRILRLVRDDVDDAVPQARLASAPHRSAGAWPDTPPTP